MIKKRKTLAMLTLLVIFASIVTVNAQEPPIAHNFRFPLAGDWAPLWQDFNGWDDKGYHLGEDVGREDADKQNYPVYPMGNGVVKFADIVLGYTVIIEHKLPVGDPDGNYVCSVYYHMKRPGEGGIHLTVGTTVSMDSPIGYVSGKWEDHKSSPHLHFGIRKGRYKTGKDSRTGYWYYPGYTTIKKDGEVQKNPNDPTHQQVLADWFNPTTDPKNGTGFIERHLAQAAPIITSPLQITPSPPYYLGDEINAEFTIVNKGVLPVTFNVLTVGGRDPDDQIADFTHRQNITLEPSESYKYKGTLTLVKTGKYHFFCAYQTSDDKWNPSIDLAHGLTDEDRTEDIIVKAKEETKPTLVRVSSPPEVIWSREFHEEMAGMSHVNLQPTSDGGYILVEDDLDGNLIALIKTDPQGQKIWEARMRYDGPWVQSFQQTSDGGYILLAHAGRFRGTDYTMYLIKTDATGHKIWEKGLEEEEKYQNTRGIFIRETPDGGYILGGNIDIQKKTHPWLMKTNSKGDIQWEKVFEEEGYAFDFQQTSDGGYILALHTGLTKTDPSGRKIWKRIYEKGLAFLAQETSDGGYILAGVTPIDVGSSEDEYHPWLMKTNSKGDPQWKTTSEHIMRIKAAVENGILQQTPDGGYILAGTIYDSKYRPWLMKTNSRGDIQWEKVFEEEGGVLSQTLDGGYILAVFSGDYHRYHLVKVRSPGEAPKKQIIEVAKEPREEKKKEKEELFSYGVDYEPIAYGGFPFLLVNVSGPADELGIILTNPEGWSTTTFISRRDLIDNFESVKVSMSEGRNPPAGTYKLVIKTITPEKVVYKTEARFTPPNVRITDAEVKIRFSKGVLGSCYWVDEYSITVENEGELPIIIDKGVITMIMPGRKIETRLGFRGVPHGEVEIKGVGDNWFTGPIGSINALVKLYSEGKEVATSPVKVTMK